MSSARYVLAVDLGSGGPKVALVARTGETLGHVRRSIQTFFVERGGAEQDAHEWWQTVSDGARELLSRRLVPPEQIVAISCTGQWSVTLPVDERGEPLMRAIHWMDSRGAKYGRQITDGLIKIQGYNVRKLIRWLRRTGGVPTHSGNDGLSHILFLKHERPDVYARAAKLLEPMDYLNLKLTGRMAASYGTIFPYMLTDNRDNRAIDYDEVILRWAGIERSKLPDLLPTGAPLGTLLPEVATDWGLLPSTQVVAASCDSQAAVLGSGAVGDGEAHLCIGTSSWLTCHVPFKKVSLDSWLTTMPAAVAGRNMVVAEQGAAGKCVEAFLRQWIYPDDPFGATLPDDAFARLEQAVATTPPGADGLLFLPWVNGAGPPGGDSAMRGGFLNQTLTTTRAHAARAVLEGVAFNLRWLVEAEERFLGRKIERLNFIGGGAQLVAWRQILADVLNRPLHCMAEPHLAISRGAAAVAFLGLGEMRLEEAATMSRVECTYTPWSEHRALYDRMFTAFVRAYRANKPVFALLNGARG